MCVSPSCRTCRTENQKQLSHNWTGFLNVKSFLKYDNGIKCLRGHSQISRKSAHNMKMSVWHAKMWRIYKMSGQTIQVKYRMTWLYRMTVSNRMTSLNRMTRFNRMKRWLLKRLRTSHSIETVYLSNDFARKICQNFQLSIHLFAV